jgi:predicted phosphodiesterase
MQTYVLLAVLATADLRFVVLGDRTGSHVPGVFEQVWKSVNATQPEFVLTAGDWIEGGQDATAEDEWRELSSFVPAARVPVFFTAGNHDIWNRASRALFEKYTGRPATYSFDWKGAHFTVLDNAQSMRLPDDQLAFLEKDLAAHTARSPKFIVMHQPSWLVSVMMKNDDFALHRLAKQHGVKAVFSGHTHGYLRRELDGVIYMTVCSAGGSLRKKGFDEGFFFGFTEVEVREDAVTIVSRELGPPFGQGRRKD